MADALLGVDRLYRKESGDETGLAVLDMSAGRDPEPFEDYAAVDARFAELQTEAERLPEPDRQVYYRQVCESTRAFVEWRTDGLDFPSQVRRFLHVDPTPPTENEIETLRDELLDELTAMGYDRPLGSAAERWQTDATVPGDESAAVLSELLTETRERTLSRFDVPPSMIPEMDARGVSDAAFNAMCDYPNRTVVINTDPTLTRPWLKKLAIHEGYPGHVLQFALREGWYEEGVAPADGLLSVVNTASSATFEGIADAGTRLLELDEGDDRIARLIGRYQTAIATLSAYRYHRCGTDEAEIRRFLSERAIFGDKGWVENRVKFLIAPERATLMYSYWHGEPTVTDAIESVREEDLPAFLSFLYGRLHSVDTVGMFASRHGDGGG